MKKYYCVTSTYYDNGEVTANITNVLISDKKPKDNFASTKSKDIYIDWFDSEQEALNHIKASTLA